MNVEGSYICRDGEGYQYPLLAIDNEGILVLFTAPKVGEILELGTSPIYNIGYKSNWWRMGKFKILSEHDRAYHAHKHRLTENQNPKGGTTMQQSQNYSTAVMLINPNIKAVKCEYEPKENNPSRTVSLFKTLNPNIKVGDLVVVPSQSRFCQCVVRVIELDADVDYDSNCRLEWIIDVVDTKAYEEVLKVEDEALVFIRAAEKAAKKKELREKLFGLKDDEEFAELAVAQIGYDNAPTENPDEEDAE